ncbi:MAG: hypothetical protein DWC03_03630 [Candidatus Poseidoniales archaeon]|nr:MAG: hypothetical protein DWC03_03630 [Candidatus Poseidoniales archaeon]
MRLNGAGRYHHRKKKNTEKNTPPLHEHPKSPVFIKQMKRLSMKDPLFEIQHIQRRNHAI